MVDMKKFAKKTLGAPPPPAAEIAMLAEPEVAPAAPPSPAQVQAPPPAPTAPRPNRMDGRSLRATGRNVQVATRITEYHKRLIYELAQRHNLMIAAVIEQGAELLRDKLEGGG